MPQKKKNTKEQKKTQVQVTDLDADKKGKDVKGGESYSFNYAKIDSYSGRKS